GVTAGEDVRLELLESAFADAGEDGELFHPFERNDRELRGGLSGGAQGFGPRESASISSASTSRWSLRSSRSGPRYSLFVARGGAAAGSRLPARTAFARVEASSPAAAAAAETGPLDGGDGSGRGGGS